MHHNLCFSCTLAGGTRAHPCAEHKHTRTARTPRKDTKHEDLRELLNAEPFGTFPPGFAFVARLSERKRGEGRGGDGETLEKRAVWWLHPWKYGVQHASYRSLVSIQHVFFCKQSQAVLQRHFPWTLLSRQRGREWIKTHFIPFTTGRHWYWDYLTNTLVHHLIPGCVKGSWIKSRFKEDT